MSWIKCKNGINLPPIKTGDNDISRDVLAFAESEVGEDDRVVQAFYSHQDEEWHESHDGDLLQYCEVTHWMPLPEPPNI